jgi:hypothetical protein
MKPVVATAIIFTSSIVFPTLLADDSTSFLQLAFETHCIKCHGEDGTIEGNVNLLALRSDDDFLSRPELLEALTMVLNDHQMPPEDEPPLSVFGFDPSHDYGVLTKDGRSRRVFSAAPDRSLILANNRLR